LDSFLAADTFEANARTPGLKRFEVTAGGNFPELILRREPDFEVVGFGCGKSHVAGAQRHHPVMKSQALQHGLCMAGQPLQFLIRLPR
jgi:hypothetical protein